MTIALILKLFLALCFGLLIGIDRQIKQKQLGLRPCMVICMASCLITIVSIHAFDKFAGANHPNMDPMRLAAQIVSGVGFIGAGVILRRSNEVISGLTSAALIWAASAIGIAVGAGFYWEAASGVVLLIIAVNAVPYLIKIAGLNNLNRHDVAVKIVVKPNYRMTELIQTIERKNTGNSKSTEYKLRHMKLRDLDNGNQQLDLILSVPEDQYTTEIYYYIKKIENVMTVDVDQL